MRPWVARWLLFRFEDEVRLYGAGTPEEIAARLAGLTSPPRSWRSADRSRVLRGRIDGNRSFLRWPINEHRFISPRSARFALFARDKGTELEGQFEVWPLVRRILLGWLWAGWLLWISILFVDLFHRRMALLGRDILFVPIAYAMAAGYVRLAVWLGRFQDRRLVSILRSTLAGTAEAEAVRRLLEAHGAASFVDEPPGPSGYGLRAS